MSRYILYTYENLDEYERYYRELEDRGEQIYNYQLESTDNLLSDDSSVTIDISALVLAISQNQLPILNGIYNLKHIDTDTKVIIKSELADTAKNYYFYSIFRDIEPLYSEEESEEETLIPFTRKILYTYKNNSQLNKIIDFVNENEIPFTNFARYNGIDNKNFNLISNEKKKAIVDITSLVNVVDKNPENIFLFEQTMQFLPFYDAIVLENVADKALKSFNFIFSANKPISELLIGLELTESESDNILEEEQIIKVNDLKSVSLINEALSSQLIGHSEFKKHFKEYLDDFMILNRVGAQKIFSIFLLGASGLGKTEVARIIKRTLNDDTPMIKINFGNYSSDNALNSLIGSPRGYIGSETGELSLKVNKSKAGIVLCDEFEKATKPVYSFFLELLEDGIFTDSLSIEHNLNGYIIVFTSNINKYQFFELIPNELQSRFDLVCDFEELTHVEKTEYVDHQIKTFLNTLNAKEDLLKLSEQDMEYFKGINVDLTNNLRDIKRNIRRRILNKLKNNSEELCKDFDTVTED